MKLKYKMIASPVGMLKIVGDSQYLVAILWEKDKLSRVKLTEMAEDKNDPLLLKVEKQLNEYFNKKRKIFDIPLKTSGTPFQEKVWEILYGIPFGITCTYKDIAVKMDNPKAVRAVGTAVGRNPISIIIPCHRVIGSDGSLTGFAGGLERKKNLLDVEVK